MFVVVGFCCFAVSSGAQRSCTGLTLGVLSEQICLYLRLARVGLDLLRVKAR